MKVWKVTIGNNFDNWMLTADTFKSAMIKAEIQLKKKGYSYQQKKITSLVLIGDLE